MSVTNDAAAKTLVFTGERYHPEVLGEIRQEHIHRYAWCLDAVAGKVVLDLASGEGFGAAMLAGRATSVTGIDVSPQAVAHAGERYRSVANLQFLTGDARAIPLESASVDAVVSFETIEHVDQQSKVIEEIRRILKPEGFLIMSSPNTEVYNERQHHFNPFHKHELTKAEFLALLAERFPAVVSFGQRLSVASTILTEDACGGENIVLYRDDGAVSRSTQTLPSTMYQIAMAAASRDCLPALDPSALVSANYDVYWELRDRLSGALRALASGEKNGLFLQKLSVDAVAKSAFFEPDVYRANAGLEEKDPFELARHYVSMGEEKGIAPSAHFDPVFYRDSNPDVVEAGVGLLLHYILAGRPEGRRNLPLDAGETERETASLE